MFKKVLSVLIGIGIASLSLQAKNIVVITDIAQGITQAEGMEVMTLINPKDEPSIYEDDDHFYGYIFTEKGRKSTSSKFVAKSTHRGYWIKFFKEQYLPYFNVVKSGVKKTIQKKHIPKDIVFLVDTSGSMKTNTQLEVIKNTLKSFIASKDKEVNVALIVFDGHKTFNHEENARVILDFTKDKNTIYSAIDSIHYTNFNTMYESGFKKAFDLLKTRKVKDKIVFLISDGDDTDKSGNIISLKKLMENTGIKIKPIAVGGASMNTLKKFSTNGNVYDATRGDMQSVIQENTNIKDPLFEKFAALSNSVFQKNKSKDSILIIYSPMMEKSDLYDFYMIPNLSDDLFYSELEEKLQKEHFNIDFSDFKVYVRLIGNPSAKKENELTIFWKRFIEDNGGKLESISKDKLQVTDIVRD